MMLGKVGVFLKQPGPCKVQDILWLPVCVGQRHPLTKLSAQLPC